MKKKRKYLYALECENECYYIGQTNDLIRRFRQHNDQGKDGSVLTSNHRPIRIVEEWNLEDFSQDDAINFENKLTIEYINKFGWKNVRGGIYIFLDEDHHWGLLNKYNYYQHGVFTPRATEEKIETFISIRRKLNQFSIKVGIPYAYVLKLKEDKFYIGRSSDLLKDIRKHLYTKKAHGHINILRLKLLKYWKIKIWALIILVILRMI